MLPPGCRPQLNDMSWQGMGTVDINDGLMMMVDSIRWADQSWLILCQLKDQVMLWSDQVMTLANNFRITILYVHSESVIDDQWCRQTERRHFAGRLSK